MLRVNVLSPTEQHSVEDMFDLLTRPGAPLLIICYFLPSLVESREKKFLPCFAFQSPRP